MYFLLSGTKNGNFSIYFEYLSERNNNYKYNLYLILQYYINSFFTYYIKTYSIYKKNIETFVLENTYILNG